MASRQFLGRASSPWLLGLDLKALKRKKIKKKFPPMQEPERKILPEVFFTIGNKDATSNLQKPARQKDNMDYSSNCQISHC